MLMLVYKGKVNPLDCGLHRPIKLLEHRFRDKCRENVIKVRKWDKTNS